MDADMGGTNIHGPTMDAL
jgi:hypothetical protein